MRKLFIGVGLLILSFLLLLTFLSFFSSKDDDVLNAVEIPNIQENKGQVEEVNVKKIASDGVIGYRINIPCFFNGDEENDGAICGDLKGVEEKLTYLKDDLHVNVLWLSTVFPTDGLSGDKVINYESIASYYGADKAFISLIDKCHEMDLLVMLDVDFNQTSTKHSWFYQSASYESYYRDFYYWSEDDTNSFSFYNNGSFYYSALGEDTAELNLLNQSVYNELLDNIKTVIGYGLDGINIVKSNKLISSYEAKEYTQENINFVKTLSQDLKKDFKNLFVMSDATTTSTYTLSTYSSITDSTVNYTMRDAIVNSLISNNSNSLDNTYTDYLNACPGVDALFLSNENTNHIINDLDFNLAKAKQAAAIMFTLPGISFINSGDELGMSGSNYLLDNYQPFKWGEDNEVSFYTQGSTLNDLTNAYDEHNLALDSYLVQNEDTDSLLSFYKEMTKIKTKYTSLTKGSFEEINLGTSLYAYKRAYDDQEILVVHNLSNEENYVDFEYNFKNASVIYQGSSNIYRDHASIGPNQTIIMELGTKSNSTINYLDIHYFPTNKTKVYDIWEWSTGAGEWHSLSEVDEKGYKNVRIDISNMMGTKFNFLIGKALNNYDWVTDSGDQVIDVYDDNGDQTCEVWIIGGELNYYFTEPIIDYETHPIVDDSDIAQNLIINYYSVDTAGQLSIWEWSASLGSRIYFNSSSSIQQATINISGLALEQFNFRICSEDFSIVDYGDRSINIIKNNGNNCEVWIKPLDGTIYYEPIPEPDSTTTDTSDVKKLIINFKYDETTENYCLWEWSIAVDGQWVYSNKKENGYLIFEIDIEGYNLDVFSYIITDDAWNKDIPQNRVIVLHDDEDHVCEVWVTSGVLEYSYQAPTI